jgi:hypothetical protein
MVYDGHVKYAYTYIYAAVENGKRKPSPSIVAHRAIVSLFVCLFVYEEIY